VGFGLNYACPICGDAFMGEDELTVHLGEQHRDVAPDEIGDLDSMRAAGGVGSPVGDVVSVGLTGSVPWWVKLLG
jgi:hypothetical protein